MQEIALKQIIRANRKALEAGTLGAETHPGENCRYVYADGSRCAIGQVLNKSTAKKLLGSIANDFTFTDLLKGKSIKFAGTKKHKAAAQTIQNFHDAWANSRSCLDVYGEDLPEFDRLIEAIGDRAVTKNTFALVLDIAEKYV